MEIVHEEWRPVVGFEGKYEVSNLGRVRSLSRDVPCLSRWGTPRTFRLTGRILKPSLDGKGYPFVNLGGDDRPLRRVHGLVAEAFIGPRQPGMEVNHKDAVRTNPVVTNLEYVTSEGNKRHAVAIGRCGKLTDEKVMEMDQLYREGNSQEKIATIVGIGQSAVSAALRRETWQHVPVVKGC